MTWEQAWVLLQIVEKATGHPPLKALRDRALADLEAIDTNAIDFHKEHEEELPDE